VTAKKELINELNFLTDVLSDRTRWLAGWVLGLSWLVMIQSSNAPGFLAPHDIIEPTALALLALLIDFSQYCFGYILNLRVLNSFPSDTESVPYDTGSLLYRLRLFAFYAKIAVALVATTWLIVVLAIRIVDTLGGGADVAGA
jgi:hypothetical protein